MSTKYYNRSCSLLIGCPQSEKLISFLKSPHRAVSIWFGCHNLQPFHLWKKQRKEDRPGHLVPGCELQTDFVLWKWDWFNHWDKWSKQCSQCELVTGLQPSPFSDARTRMRMYSCTILPAHTYPYARKCHQCIVMGGCWGEDIFCKGQREDICLWWRLKGCQRHGLGNVNTNLLYS